MTTTKTTTGAFTRAGLILAGFALLGTGAGVGFAAGQIGTNQIKNNAVTSAKIKNGTVSDKDMVKEKKRTKATLSNGGEGDCLWSVGMGAPYGFGLPTYRKDRFGRVHLSGYAGRSDAPGGDGACDGSGVGQANDAIVFTLPKGFMPPNTLITGAGESVFLVVGVDGLSAPGVFIPGGSVVVLTGEEIALDGFSFDPSTSKAVKKGAPSGRITPRMLADLGGR